MCACGMPTTPLSKTCFHLRRRTTIMVMGACSPSVCPTTSRKRWHQPSTFARQHGLALLIENLDAGDHSPPSQSSKTVLSIVKIGPLEEDRTAHKHRGVKDHRSPNYIAKRTFLPSLRSDIHDTGIASPRCVDRLPSHISKMVVSTVSGGGLACPVLRTFRWEVSI